MSKSDSPQYWVFSNKRDGAYGGSIWDMTTVLKKQSYSIKESQANRKRVRPGDVVYMRIFGRSFIGRFIVDGPWKALPARQQKWKDTAGAFPMSEIEIWSRPIPQSLVLPLLSNQNHRGRIMRINHDDGVAIETAQRVYVKLGFGDADGKVVILEKGLEEAIKPNLGKQFGLKLAGDKIRQQFAMGVDVGRSDLICIDENGDYVVIELKRGMTSDETIGQVLRYVGWMKENMAAEGQEVHGWIVAGDYDEQLRLAASAAGIKLLLVRLG